MAAVTAEAKQRQADRTRLAQARRAVMLNTTKLIFGCSRCGYNREAGALQFHHRDAATKLFHVGNAAIHQTLEVARAEIEKCDLLCANCHAEVTHGAVA